MEHPKYLFGAGGFTTAWKDRDLDELLEILQHSGIDQIDSAATYPYHAPGEADRLLGNHGFAEKGFTIDTKILFFGDGSGTMTAEAIQKSLQGSLRDLKVNKVSISCLREP